MAAQEHKRFLSKAKLYTLASQSDGQTGRKDNENTETTGPWASKGPK